MSDADGLRRMRFTGTRDNSSNSSQWLRRNAWQQTGKFRRKFLGFASQPKLWQHRQREESFAECYGDQHQRRSVDDSANGIFKFPV
jgi:hypothetical protein